MNKKIFGYDFNFTFNGICENLIDELRFYPDIIENNNNFKKVNVEFTFKDNTEALSSNPSLIGVCNKGFYQNLGYAKLFWDLSELNNNTIGVKIIVPKSENSVFKRSIRRFLSIGYEVFPENIGQVMHELVFVPTTFFFQDKVLIHGSCLHNNKANSTVIFGGTGGVGKTSSLLEMGKDKNWVFLSDDIVVIDENRVIYPNYAYPKIYAYNTLDDKELERSIQNEKSLTSNLQWKLKKKRNPASVRRITPNLLYKTEYAELPLKTNLFLFRGKYDGDITVEKINSLKSSLLEENIIFPEYEAVFKFIKWYEYNADALGIETKVKFEDILLRYRQMYNKIFTSTENYIVKIPSEMNHTTFKSKMIEKTLELLKEDA